jgi:dinuclear metal center YbgI/SA1388 family protein
MIYASEVINILENNFPLSFQENYDNSGLQIGNKNTEVNSILITIDITEQVIDEAISLGANLVISHHPLIFNPIKKISGESYIDRIIIKAIRNDIVLYSVHTNADNLITGVNEKICKKIGLANLNILAPQSNVLVKMVTFVPENFAHIVRDALFKAGAGHIGNYDNCSFNVSGTGTFRAGENTKPFTGQKGEIHFEKEIRIETIFPQNLQNKIISALLKSHPYEEVAYDLYPLYNKYYLAGSGMTGLLNEAEDEEKFLHRIKNIFNVKVIRHSKLLNKKIKKVALCGGSGSFLLKDAINAGCDIFISADFKYHQFFDADNKIIIADIGHFESEQFTKEIFYDILKKNFSNFAVHLSKINTNPINYL